MSAISEMAKEIHKDCPKAVLEVLRERMSQNKRWGEQNHEAYIWLAILQEEVGELAQSLLQTDFGGDKGGRNNLHEEIVQTAAVALAMVECSNRMKWGECYFPTEKGAR